MDPYTEIGSRTDIEHWLERVGHFHDGVLKEIHLSNRASVSSDRSMQCEQWFDARVLIQSPWGPRAFELLLIGLLELHLEDQGSAEIAGAEIERLEDVATGAVSYRVRLDEEHSFQCRRLFIRERQDWLEKSTRFGAEIPSPDAPQAMDLGQSWYLCPTCTEGFEARRGEEYTVCPGCRQVIDLGPDRA